MFPTPSSFDKPHFFTDVESVIYWVKTCLCETLTQYLGSKLSVHLHLHFSEMCGKKTGCKLKNAILFCFFHVKVIVP